MQNKLFYIESAQSQNRNWFSYVVNDPVNYIDPFGLTSTDAGNTSKIASRWSDTKATVKGWGESIKSDITQTWNDIKQVVSNAITGTVSVAKTVVSNIQTNVTKWISEGKAEVIQLGKDIKTEASKAVVRAGVNLFGLFAGFETTQKLYNDALNNNLNSEITNIIEDKYGLEEGLKGELANTKVVGTSDSLIETIANDLKNAKFNSENGFDNLIGKKYNVDVGINPGISDMEVAIGKHEVTILAVSKDGTTVTLLAHDTFDFDSQEVGCRTSFNESLTTLGRNANLPDAEINIYYQLNIE